MRINLYCNSIVYFTKSGGEPFSLKYPGSYWRSLFVMLQDYGLNPILVNGKFTKNVKGKITDMLDCKWIQKLHMLGLMEGSFIPDLFTETLRQYCRHRQTLLEDAAGYIKKNAKRVKIFPQNPNKYICNIQVNQLL